MPKMTTLFDPAYSHLIDPLSQRRLEYSFQLVFRAYMHGIAVDPLTRYDILVVEVKLGSKQL